MTIGVILAAGLGTRLRPLTDDRPKCMMDLGGETILHRLVRQLAEAGVRAVVVATGYEAARVRASLRDAPAAVTFAHCPDYATTQNSVSLLRALEAAPEGPVVKFDGDLVLPTGVVSLGAEAEGSAVLVDDRVPPRAEAMKVRCDGDIAVAFGKSLNPEACRGESIGVERLSAEGRALVRDALRGAVEDGRTDLYYEEVYERAIARGLRLRARSVGEAPWTEVDDLHDLERARGLVRRGL